MSSKIYGLLLVSLSFYSEVDCKKLTVLSLLSPETFYCLATGGYGYSYVFAVKIWRATGWGKLMQAAVLQLNIIFFLTHYVHVYEIDQSI